MINIGNCGLLKDV